MKRLTSNILRHRGEIISPLLLLCVSTPVVLPHSSSCCFSYCVTGHEAENWCCAGVVPFKSWGMRVSSEMPAPLNHCSWFPQGSRPNANHQASAYQGCCALQADRKLLLLMVLMGWFVKLVTLWHRLILIVFTRYHTCTVMLPHDTLVCCRDHTQNTDAVFMLQAKKCCVHCYPTRLKKQLWDCGVTCSILFMSMAEASKPLHKLLCGFILLLNYL